MPDNSSIGLENIDSGFGFDEVKVLGKIDQHNTMLGGIVRIGRVVATEAQQAEESDPEKPHDIPRILVQIGASGPDSFIRNWLPWITSRAGYDGEWWRPDIDEQVLVVAPSGNIEQGFIIGSLYRGLATDNSAPGITVSDPVPQSETDKQIHQRIYQDGSRFSYDRNTHTLAVELKTDPEQTDAIRFSATMEPGSGSVKFNIGEESAPDFELAIKSGQNMVLSAGATIITVSKDGAIDIDAGANDINIKGNVKVTGALDVS